MCQTFVAGGVWLTRDCPAFPVPSRFCTGTNKTQLATCAGCAAELQCGGGGVQCAVWVGTQSSDKATEDEQCILQNVRGVLKMSDWSALPYWSYTCAQGPSFVTREICEMESAEGASSARNSVRTYSLTTLSFMKTVRGFQGLA